MIVARPAKQTPARRAANVTLPVDLLAEARALGLNVSQICERVLSAEIAKTRAELWRADNRAALISSNDYVERHGLALAECRQF
nr:type II toxin-antitoxin system CcdA family antitoxin [Acidisoma sp. PAMC 29798]